MGKSKIANLIEEMLLIEDENARTEELEKIVGNLINYFKRRTDITTRDRINLLCNIDLVLKQKLKFFMMASHCKADESFTLEIIPFCMSKCVFEEKGGLKKEVMNLLQTDIEFQKEYAEYFKYMDYSYYIEHSEQSNLRDILQLDSFKEIVLEDEEFIAKCLANKACFFKCLPKEFGYLISLYNETQLEGLQDLYRIYFGEIFSEEQINELSKLQQEMNSSVNIFKVDDYIRKANLTYTLAKASTDSEFWQKLKKLQEVSGIDLKTATMFISKYYESKIFEELLNQSNISLESIKKIEYLAGEATIDNIDEFSSLDEVDMETLRAAPKTWKTGSIAHLMGGPDTSKRQSTSNDDFRFFKDSKSCREYRIIYKDGQIIKKALSILEDHGKTIRKMFKGQVNNIDDKMEPIEVCLTAADEIGAITFMIENEQCAIHSPDELTIEQKKAVFELLKKAREDGKIGFYIFIRELKENDTKREGKNILDFSTILNNADTMGVEAAKETVLHLGGRTTEEELRNVEIPEEKEFIEQSEGR